jgi:hypothetical protein
VAGVVVTAADTAHIKKKKTMEKELLSTVLQIQAQLKVLHWQTESYAEHNAFGTTYDSLDDKFDLLIEAYAGKHQRPKLGGVSQLSVADYSNVKVDVLLDGVLEFFASAFMADSDSELKNIADEIKADIDKLKYLLTLK